MRYIAFLLIIIPLNAFSTFYIEGSFKQKMEVRKCLRIGYKNSSTFRHLIDDMENIDIYIKCNKDSLNSSGGKYINFDPYSDIELGEGQPNSVNWITLGHELAHIWLDYNGIVDDLNFNSAKYNKEDISFDWVLYCEKYNDNILNNRKRHEELATMIENSIRRESGLEERTIYGNLQLIYHYKEILIENNKTCEVILYDNKIGVKSEIIVYPSKYINLDELKKTGVKYLDLLGEKS